MLRSIVLLAPIFVSLFWAVTLAGDKNKYGTPRLFLSKFMILVAILFARHYVYFTPYPDLFVYFDIPYQLLGLIIFPLYHIYFRLLMVDKKFPIKAHLWFLIVPLGEVLIYCIAVLFAPDGEYQAWLLNQEAETGSASIRFLNNMLVVMRLTFLVSLVLTVVANQWLIIKHGDKALQFYSDAMESGKRSIMILNYSILVLSFTTFAFVIIGRVFIMPKEWLIYSGWTMFTVLIYFMGNLGLKQKILNPSLMEDEQLHEGQNLSDSTGTKKSELMDKIIFEFAVNRVHLNPELNISDLVTKIGTNRSYLSSIFNQKFNQNFCSYVNSYRIEELENILRKNPLISNYHLAERSGFGTVNSMKRSVCLKSGQSLNTFKNSILNK